MATPGVLLVIIGDGLECCQDGREKRRRGWRGLKLRETIGITLILTAHTDTQISTKDRFFSLTNIFHTFFLFFLISISLIHTLIQLITEEKN